MSFSLGGQIPLANTNDAPTSPLGYLAQWGEVQKGQLQNQGMNLQNQQAQLLLGLRNQLAGAVGAGQPNTGQVTSGILPGGGIGAGGGGQPGQVTSGISPGGGAAAQGGGGFQQVSPFAVMSPYGVPMPRMQMISAAMSNDPMKAITDSYNMGRQRVTQLLTQAGNPNDPDPAKAAQAQAMVKAAAGQLYTEGWIDPNGYQGLMSDPNKAGAFIRGTASPDEHMKQATSLGVKGLTTDSNGNVVYDPNAAAGLATAAGQEAGSVAAAKVGPETQLEKNKQDIKNRSDIVTVDMPGPAGSDGKPTVIPTQMLKSDAIQRGLLAPDGGGGGGATGGMTPTKVFNGLLGTEASGANAVSGKGATGKAQILEDTFNRYKLPGESYSNEDDRMAAGRRYVDAMWKQYPNDPARVAVGYFSGVGNIAPAGSKTPYINDTSDGNMPVSQYVDRFTGKLGVPPATAPGADATAPTAAPAVGRPGQGQPKLSPQQQANVDQQKEIGVDAGKSTIKQITDYQDAMVEKAQTAQRMNALIDQARLESASWTSGPFANYKMQALKMLDGLRNNINSLAGHEILGKPDQSVGDWEAFNKNMLANVSAVVREVSPRAAVQEFQTLQKAQPQDSTTPQGMRNLFDEMQGIGDWYQAKSAASGKLDKATGSTNQFESNWNSNITPMAFIVHRMSTDDFRTLSSRLSQTPEGRATLSGIVKQMQFLDSQGLFNENNAGLPSGRVTTR